MFTPASFLKAVARRAHKSLCMMLGSVVLSAAVVQTAGAGQSMREGRKEIVWAFYNSDPVHINSGPFKGQGFGDKTLKDLEAMMPDYHFSYREVGAARMMLLLEGQTPFCSSLLLKTPERAQKYLYSRPIHVLRGNHLILQRDRVGDLPRQVTGENGGIDLKELADAGFTRTAIMRRRLLGPVIGPHVAALKASGHAVEVDDMDAVTALMQHNRIDYMFATPEEVVYYERADPAAFKGKLVAVPVAGSPSQLIGYYVCTKTPETQAFLDDLGHLMDGFKGVPPWYSHYVEWAGENPAPGEALLSGKAGD